MTSNAQRDVNEAYILHASSYVVKSASFADFLEQLERILHYWRLSRTVHDKAFEAKL